MSRLAQTYEAMARWPDRNSRSHLHATAENWKALERTPTFRIISRAANRLGVIVRLVS